MTTKKLRIGDLWLGGGEPIVVQGMTKTFTSDVKATIAQINKMEKEIKSMLSRLISNI